MPSHRSSRRSGFTLIELSIVLVIIGLIVGGVLVGQDLIAAAQVRATVSQIEKYNTSVNTFQIKYNGLPGDLSSSQANNIGMTGVYLLSGAQGQGDGNGIIEDGSCAAAGTGGVDLNYFCGEISTFWAQLSWANLINGGFGANGTTGTGVPATAATLSTLAQYIPPAKLGRGLYITVFSGGGTNSYAMLPITAIAITGIYTVNSTGIDPITAQMIDGKMDDGLPLTGNVMAAGVVAPLVGDSVLMLTPGSAPYYGLFPPSFDAAPWPNICAYYTQVNGTDYFQYDTDAHHGGTDPTCAMAFRFQ